MLLSTAFSATKVKTEEDAATGLPTARLEAAPVLPFLVTVLLLPDVLPAASLARTKYETVALADWVSVYVSTLPATLPRRTLSA